VDPDEDLVLLGDGSLDVFQSKNLRRPVPVADHCSHWLSASLVGWLRIPQGSPVPPHPALVIATTGSGEQIDLLVVPPRTAEAAARAAMARAADPTSTMRAPQILAAIPAASDRVPAGDAGQDADAGSAWDDEAATPSATVRAGP
jgi:hypothetical protein